MPKSEPSQPVRRAPSGGVWRVLQNLPAHQFRRRAPYKNVVLEHVSFKHRIVVDVAGARSSKARDALLKREGFRLVRLAADAQPAHVRRTIAEAIRPPRPRRSAGGMVLTAVVSPAPNPAKQKDMAKRKASAPKAQRRPRGEIDRNYFFGDVLIKTGVAVFIALALIALYTPVTLMGAVNDGMYDYLGVMGAFGAISFLLFMAGRHLRREATHWDFD